MNNYLPLYYLNACNNKSDEKGCGLLGSAYMLNMLNNGSDMGDMASVFPLVALNKFLNNRFSFFAEALAGVAGGAGVDTGEGIIIKPSTGINYHLNDNLSFHFSGGQVFAPFGNVNSKNINIGLTYGLSLLNAKK